MVSEVCSVQEHRSTDSGLDSRFWNPGKTEEHLLLAGEFGLARSDDRTNPSHGDAKEDDQNGK